MEPIVMYGLAVLLGILIQWRIIESAVKSGTLRAMRAFEKEKQKID